LSAGFFNVPIEDTATMLQFTDDTRVREALPTNHWLRHKRETDFDVTFWTAQRPAGREYSLRPVGDQLTLH